MRARVILLTCIGLVSAWSGAAAQEVRSETRLSTFSFGSAGELQADQVQLAASTFSVGWSRGPVSIVGQGAFARGIATLGGEGFSEISGLTDATIRVAGQLGNLTATGIAILPTGEATHAIEDILVLGVMNSDLLPFPVTRWGSGGGQGAALTYDVRGASTEVRVGGAYLLPGEHSFLEGESITFRPGRELQITARMAARFGDGVLTASAALHESQADEYGGVNLYQSGRRVVLGAGIAHPLGARESVSVRATLTSREAGVVRTISEFQGGRLLPGIGGADSRSLGTLEMTLLVDRGRSSFVPELGLRRLTTASGIGNGWLATLGVASDVRAVGGAWGRGVTLSPRVAGHYGSHAGAPSGSRRIVGWEAGLGIAWWRR